MEIIKLPVGEPAPRDADCVGIDEQPQGFMLSATALVQCDNDSESTSLIGGDPYATYEEAEAAGLAWAADRCAGVVYVSRNAAIPE